MLRSGFCNFIEFNFLWHQCPHRPPPPQHIAFWGPDPIVFFLIAWRRGRGGERWGGLMFFIFSVYLFMFTPAQGNNPLPPWCAGSVSRWLGCFNKNINTVPLFSFLRLTWLILYKKKWLLYFPSSALRLKERTLAPIIMEGESARATNLISQLGICIHWDLHYFQR